MVLESVGKNIERMREISERRMHDRRENCIISYAYKGKEAIDGHIRDLDEEWDVERMLEANASIAAIVGLTFGALIGKKWLVLPALVSGFLLQHAFSGWCLPVEAFRRMGIRTRSEIDRERCAMKALRGDFENLPKLSDEAVLKVRELLNSIEK